MGITAGYTWKDGEEEAMAKKLNLGFSGATAISGMSGSFTTLSVTSTTDSTSTITGAVTIAGGLGVAKQIYALGMNTATLTSPGSTFDVVTSGGQNARFSGTHLLLGGLTTDGTGVLQFPSATTSAGGISFGTDTNRCGIYRTTTSNLQLDNVGNINSSVGLNIVTTAGNLTIGANSGASTTILKSGSFITALTLDASQNATFAKNVTVSGTTDTSSTATGSITTLGGLGIAKSATFGNHIFLTSAAGTGINSYFQSAGVTRWAVSKDNTAETGSDAGSDFAIFAFTDAGSLVDKCVTITRAAGGVFSTTRPFSASTVKATSAAGYISSDGSTGYTGTVTSASLVGKTITIKDGIVTAFA